MFSKWVGQQKSELLGYVKAHVKLFQQNKTYASRFESALDKVTHSLFLAYQRPTDPSAFSFKMAEIMRKGEFIFLEKPNGKAKSKMPHAELQIVDYLYANRLSNVNLSEPIYIGVSKKCCGNCESAMLALNAVMGSKVIAVRGDGHGFNFLAGIPEFLRRNNKIQEAFLMLRDVDTLEKAFINDPGRISGDDQLLTPSASVYESTSTHDSYEKTYPANPSIDEESSEIFIPLEVSSAKKIVKTLQSAPVLAVAAAPRSPQKPKQDIHSKAKKKNSAEPTAGQKKDQRKAKNTQQKSQLSAPSLMFAVPESKAKKKNAAPSVAKNKSPAKSKANTVGIKK
ncbi:MAG: hypothetical protein SFW07_01440 [Gammaproteobacteria bacterium]|nr:hypothetical protein [Gammaproteobacteria bacterium]